VGLGDVDSQALDGNSLGFPMLFMPALLTLFDDSFGKDGALNMQGAG